MNIEWIDQQLALVSGGTTESVVEAAMWDNYPMVLEALRDILTLCDEADRRSAFVFPSQKVRTDLIRGATRRRFDERMTSV